MAFKKAARVAGITLADLYWVIVQINLNIADRTGVFTFYGWKDRATWQARGKADAATGEINQPVPGAVKTYVVPGGAFDALMAQYLGGWAPGKVPINLAAVLYSRAKATKDIGTPPATPIDPDTRTSFWDGATEIFEPGQG